MKSKLLAATFLIIFLCACSPLALINLTSASDHYERYTDLVYGEQHRQKLDIYIPKQVTENNDAHKVLIIFFYGGSWDSGSKDKYKFVASTLTKKGYTVAIPDYRIYPEVTYPAFVEDAAQAVAWLENNKEYLQNVEKIFLMGHSAGAQIAGLLATDERYLKDAGSNVSGLAGFIGLAGPYNFLPLKSKKLKKIFPENIRETSQPINYVDGSEIPFLLLHGKDDTTVVPENSITLAEKVLQNDGSVTLRLYEKTSHIKIMQPFISGLDDSTPTLNDVMQFIDTH